MLCMYMLVITIVFGILADLKVCHPMKFVVIDLFVKRGFCIIYNMFG